MKGEHFNDTMLCSFYRKIERGGGGEIFPASSPVTPNLALGLLNALLKKALTPTDERDLLAWVLSRESDTCKHGENFLFAVVLGCALIARYLYC